MATITVTTTYPDNLQVELRDVLCIEFGYQDIIKGQPNPETKAQFIQRTLNYQFRQFLKSSYEQGKRKQQAITAIDFN